MNLIKVRVGGNWPSLIWYLFDLFTNQNQSSSSFGSVGRSQLTFPTLRRSVFKYFTLYALCPRFQHSGCFHQEPLVVIYKDVERWEGFNLVCILPTVRRRCFHSHNLTYYRYSSDERFSHTHNGSEILRLGICIYNYVFYPFSHLKRIVSWHSPSF